MSAALLWSTIGPAAALLPADASPPAVGAVRMLGGGLLLLVWCRVGKLRGPVLPLLLAAGAMAAYQACYFTALEVAGVAVGSVVAMTSVPVFAGLIAVVRRKGGVSPKWTVATGLAIAGAVLLAFARPGGEPIVAGVLVALAAGVSYAVFTTASAAVIQGGGQPGATMAVVFLGSGVLLAPVLVVHPPGWLLTGPGAGVAGYLVVVASAVAYVLMGRGLRTTTPATASTLVLVEPACAAVIGVAVLHEPMTGFSAVGLVLLAVALALLSRPA